MRDSQSENVTDQNPSPTLPIIDEPSKHRGEEVAANQEKSIYGQISTSLMLEVLSRLLQYHKGQSGRDQCTYNVGNRAFAERFDRRLEETLQDLTRNPFTVRRRIWSPYQDSLGDSARLAHTCVTKCYLPLWPTWRIDKQDACHTAMPKAAISSIPSEE